MNFVYYKNYLQNIFYWHMYMNIWQNVPKIFYLCLQKNWAQNFWMTMDGSTRHPWRWMIRMDDPDLYVNWSWMTPIPNGGYIVLICPKNHPFKLGGKIDGWFQKQNGWRVIPAPTLVEFYGVRGWRVIPHPSKFSKIFRKILFSKNIFQKIFFEKVLREFWPTR